MTHSNPDQIVGAAKDLGGDGFVDLLQEGTSCGKSSAEVIGEE